jgi:hypothetical protein
MLSTSKRLGDLKKKANRSSHKSELIVNRSALTVITLKEKKGFEKN